MMVEVRGITFRFVTIIHLQATMETLLSIGIQPGIQYPAVTRASMSTTTATEHLIEVTALQNQRQSLHH